MTSHNEIGTLIVTIENNMAKVEFGHPASNSFPRNLLDRLAEQFLELSKNNSVSVIILCSSGKGTFCAGASFDELLNVSNREEATHFFLGFANLLNAMRSCSKIIIGRIQGKAVGGGVGIIAACDYALATNGSDIKLSELAIGIGPFVIEPAVSRKIGKSAVTDLTLETDWKPASWALQHGLYSKVYQNQEDLDVSCIAFANKLANYNPEALSEMKKVLWEGTENWPSLLNERAKISGKLILSDFAKNAINQFKK